MRLKAAVGLACAVCLLGLAGCVHSPQLQRVTLPLNVTKLIAVKWSPTADALLCVGIFPALPTEADPEALVTVRGMVVGLDGQVKATTPGPVDLRPEWGPDGASVVTQSATDGLQRLDMATGKLSQVPIQFEGLKPDEVWYEALAYSPDGKWLAASLLPIGSGHSLWLASLDGGTGVARKLALSEDFWVRGIAWAPSSKRFAAMAIGGRELDEWLPTLLVYDVETGKLAPPRLKMRAESYAGQPLTWTSDSREVCYMEYMEPTRLRFLAEAPGTDEPRLLFEYVARKGRRAWGNTWAPGAKAAVVVDVPGDFNPSANRPVDSWLVWISSTRELRQQLGGRVDQLAWSPDGKWLALVRNGNELDFLRVPAGFEAAREG